MKLLGFQIANNRGRNIAGDDDDPTGFASFEVMAPQMTIQWIEKNAGKVSAGGYLLMPIFESDIEEPSVLIEVE